MARFRLLGKHYLNVPGTKWEQIEVSQATKRQIRHQYDVHMFLDPEDPGTHPFFNGDKAPEFIVATVPSPQWPQDIIFVGAPSREMEPLDDEARALLARLPGIPPMGAEAFPATAAPAQVSAAPSALDEMRGMMAELRGTVTELVGQNEALRQQIARMEEEKLDVEPGVTPRRPTTEGLNLGV